jgi:tRNA modification GTPase
MLAGRRPAPRRATLAVIRHPANGEVLDNAIIIYFPGPGSATGEDLVELHVHGGKAVVAAVLAALATIDGLRPAEPGDFTRRAFENGRMDLTEVEGLSDLLFAETETQRRSAMALAAGGLRRQIEDWRRSLLDLSALLEAVLDLSDEGEVGEDMPDGWSDDLRALERGWADALARPPVERLRDGIRVVIAGPPNVGKSSLLNAMVGRDAAIISPEAGTTRDVIEAPTAIGGTPFLLTDTAGLREAGGQVEAIGIARAQEKVAEADILLWLGPPESCPDRDGAILVQSKADLCSTAQRSGGVDHHVSVVSGEGLEGLTKALLERARELLPRPGEAALNLRHRALIAEGLQALREAGATRDMVIAAESLRHARSALDRITGGAGVEDMLDALFGTFCVGK